jgi:hypothetical protein
MEGKTELYVEVLEADAAGRYTSEVRGLVVFNAGELEALRTLGDLRARIGSELGDVLDFSYVFVRDSVAVANKEESSRDAMWAVKKESVHKGKKAITEYKVTVKKLGRSKGTQAQGSTPGSAVLGRSPSQARGGQMTSFDLDARSAHSGSQVGGGGGGQGSTSRSLSSGGEGEALVKDQGFMARLDIFAGAFQRFFFQLDSSKTLYAYGPCTAGQFEYEFQSVSRADAADSISLADVYRIKPYDGNIPPPRAHFCLEMYTQSGAKWVLAVPTVVEFAKWVKHLHRCSSKLPSLQYNIVHDKFTWNAVPKDKSGAAGGGSTLGGSRGSTLGGGGGNGNGSVVGGSSAGGGSKSGDAASSAGRSETRIKTFKVVTFTDPQFGLQLSSCPDGTQVYSVLKDGPAGRQGVQDGDLVVSVNDKSVVGVRWRDVRMEILNASRPVRITFGKPSKRKRAANAAANIAVSSPYAAGSREGGPGLAGGSGSRAEGGLRAEVGIDDSVSVNSGVAFRRRLGPYLYSFSDKVRSKMRVGGGGGSSSGGAAGAGGRSITELASSPSSAGPQYPVYQWDNDDEVPQGSSGGGGGGKQRPIAPPRSPGPSPGVMRGLSPQGQPTAASVGAMSPRAGSPGGKPLRAGNFSIEDGDDGGAGSAQAAASRQLTRYRSTQRQLYAAIEDSFRREQEVDKLLKNMLDEAKNEAKRTGVPAGVALELRNGEAAVARTRSIRDDLAVSSRVKASKVTAARASRLDHAMRKAAAGEGPHEQEQGQGGARMASTAAGSFASFQTTNTARTANTSRSVSSAPPAAPRNAVCAMFCLPFRWLLQRVRGSEREKVLALISMARSGGPLEEREDALDAILDIASTSSSSGLLVEAGIIPVLMEALRSTESISLKENAAGILWNLSDDAAVAVQIVAAGAVPLLLDLLRFAADDEKSSDIAKEEAAGALWNLADAAECKQAMIKHGGVAVVVKALTDSSNETTEFTKENLAGVVWNLAFDPNCLDAIMAESLGAGAAAGGGGGGGEKPGSSSEARGGSGDKSPKGEDKDKDKGPIAALARLITKGTVVAQENAAGAIMRISLARVYRDRIKRTTDAIPALVQLLAFGSVPARENACGALHNLAVNDDKVQRLIAEEGAIPPLVRLLQPQFSAQVRSRAALCLRTLAQNAENKKEISQAGSVELLVSALKDDDAWLQVHIVEALWGLAHESEENKVFIAQSGAIPRLVQILRTGNGMAKARAAGALGALAENKNNLGSIVRSGALEPLVEMLSSGQRESQREAAAALGNLTRGSPIVQQQVLKSLHGGASIGVHKQDRNDINSVRRKLVELEEIDDDDLFDYLLSEQQGGSKFESKEDSEDRSL